MPNYLVAQQLNSSCRQDPSAVAAAEGQGGFVQPTGAQPDTRPSGSDPIGAGIDAELERSRQGDRSGLDDALQIS